MKKLFLALALSAAACLAGCSDNEEIGYDIGSKVLIPKNGLQQVALTADAAAIDYEVWIYRSGYNEGGSTAALSVDAEALAAYNKANGTAYVLMPEACYDLPTAAVRLDNNAHTAKIGIRIDVSAITAVAGLGFPGGQSLLAARFGRQSRHGGERGGRHGADLPGPPHDGEA